MPSRPNRHPCNSSCSEGIRLGFRTIPGAQALRRLDTMPSVLPPIASRTSLALCQWQFRDLMAQQRDDHQAEIGRLQSTYSQTLEALTPKVSQAAGATAEAAETSAEAAKSVKRAARAAPAQPRPITEAKRNQVNRDIEAASGSLEAGWNHMLAPMGLTVAELRHAPQGIRVPVEDVEMKYATSTDRRPFNTPTGLVELYSGRLLRHGHPPLPHLMLVIHLANYKLRSDASIVSWIADNLCILDRASKAPFEQKGAFALVRSA